jgi:hypothetical protein
MLPARSFVYLAAAAVILSASIGARLWLARDVFYRTSPTGLLLFKNFRSVLGFRFVAGIVRLLSLFGIVIGLGFVILALTANGNGP